MNKDILKIVFVTGWYSEKMGYSENFLPKAMAELGHEVHVISSTAQVYFNSSAYTKTYEPFIGPPLVPPGSKKIDGYTLHRLPLRKTFLKSVIRIQGLEEKIRELAPDIVQVFEINAVLSYDVAKVIQGSGICLFTESHVHASVFKTSDWKTRLKFKCLGLPAKIGFINRLTVKHYPIAADVAKLSASYFSVPPEKIRLQSLGVDTGLFKPVTEITADKRHALRKQLGFAEDDIVCIYTGRFTADKNPQCLALAVQYLHEKGFTKFKGLFVGSGTDNDIAVLQSAKGNVVHPFVKVNNLPPFYQAADIGVWPKQESTSQLDAMACGLPIVVSNKVEVLERVEGNGLLYEENNYIDLAQKLIALQDTSLREALAAVAIQKVKTHFSWEAIARERLKDYTDCLVRRTDMNMP